MARDNYLCQLCLQEGKTTLAETVDHKVPRAHGGTDEEANLWALCWPHHRRKTAREHTRSRYVMRSPEPEQPERNLNGT